MIQSSSIFKNFEKTKSLVFEKNRNKNQTFKFVLKT
jgi:hypothetical protein